MEDEELERQKEFYLWKKAQREKALDEWSKAAFIGTAIVLCVLAVIVYFE